MHEESTSNNGPEVAHPKEISLEELRVHLEFKSNTTEGSAEIERRALIETEERFSELSRYEKTLNTILARYGVESVVRRAGPDNFEVPLTSDSSLPKLPNGYGFKGGAARAALLAALGMGTEKPRDIDIVRTGKVTNDSLERELAEKYMPEDFANGDGVEPLEQNYFDTRDFTMNEVLVDGNRITCTKDALLDTVRGIIRLSDHEWPEEEDQEVYGKLLAKALRLAADMAHKGREVTLADGTIYESQNIEPFFMALHLDRAFEQGHSVATRYVDNLVDKGQIPEDITTPEQAIVYLRELLESPYVFRHAPQAQIVEEPSWIDDMYGRYGAEIEDAERGLAT